MLKKEVMKTQSKDLEKGAEYRQLLVQAIHSWCGAAAFSLRTIIEKLVCIFWLPLRPCCPPCRSTLLQFCVLGTREDECSPINDAQQGTIFRGSRLPHARLL